MFLTIACFIFFAVFSATTDCVSGTRWRASATCCFLILNQTLVMFLWNWSGSKTTVRLFYCLCVCVSIMRIMEESKQVDRSISRKQL